MYLVGLYIYIVIMFVIVAEINNELRMIIGVCYVKIKLSFFQIRFIFISGYTNNSLLFSYALHCIMPSEILTV